MKQKPLWLKWIFCTVPAMIAALMYFLLPYFPELTEYFITRGIFRIIAFPLEWIVSFLPFSITEAVVILGIPLLLFLFILWIMRIIRAKKRILIFEKGCRFVAGCISAAILMFMLMDGANFSRISLGELLDLPNNNYTAEDLYILTSDLVEKASVAREALPEDENGFTVLSVKQSEFLRLADDCYKPLQDEYKFLKTAVWRVKPVMLSHLWSYTGYTGVYCPWTGEASVNVDVPDCDLGHTATHELAHTMGFAKENECNFLAWLACSVSNQPDYVYSGYLQAFIYCSNALYKADKELWRQAYAKCSDGLIRDLKQRSDYWKSFEGEIQYSSQKFNDSFIKANGVESGVFSYNEMVELMLRYYDKYKLL